MTSKSQQRKGSDGAPSALDAAIQALNLAKDTCGISTAQNVFSHAGVLLTAIRDTVAKKRGYVDLGMCCADVCEALDRGLQGKQSEELSKSVLGAIQKLTTTVVEIQGKVAERSKRNVFSQAFHARDDKDAIASWKQDLNRIIHIFNTELVLNTHMSVADMHRNRLVNKDRTPLRRKSTRASVALGEMPPPPPRACFGREGLIEEIIGHAEKLEPVALIGAGGIGKTSIALAVLHNERIKDRFGDNRRFIRCDQFPASRSHLLARLSQVIGAGIENPDDLASLRPFLSSTETILFLDNAESILDPQGRGAQEIYAVVEELSRFSNLCLGITSRISIIPPQCKHPEIPTLPMEAARDIFYSIYENGKRFDAIDNLLQQLDFHALSITLLATAASHNKWGYNRLMREWETHRTSVLRTHYNGSLAATIELTLASPMFRKLGPDARDLLGVIAFFPQGVDENNVEWLFPTISDRNNILDNFCTLSLTHRSDDFITMLAPIRDLLRPREPKFSPLLFATKDRYFTRLSVSVHPDNPGFVESRWVMSEDVNVEHLIDVFTSVDGSSDNAWTTFFHFTEHLYWHKPRETVLKPKVEGLPDYHDSKSDCLMGLSRLLQQVGDLEESKRLLFRATELRRQQGDDIGVARALRDLSIANWKLDVNKEGIEQAREALEIFERFDSVSEQVNCLNLLGALLLDDQQPDEAEEAVSRALKLTPENGWEFSLCQSHRVLGDIYHSKGKKEEAIRHFELALGAASTSHWKDELFSIHYYMARLFLSEGEFDNSITHVNYAKSHAINHVYNLGLVTLINAEILYHQRKLEAATFEALDATAIFERHGSPREIGECRNLLDQIEQAKESAGPPAPTTHRTPSDT